MMFVSRKSYKDLEAKYEFLTITARVFREIAEERFLQYQSQLDDMRRLVFPVAQKSPEPVVLEADSVLGGSEKPIEISEEEHNKLLNQAREADLLFSGNYSEDLLSE